MSNDDFKARLIEESEQLTGRLDRLEAFIESDKDDERAWIEPDYVERLDGGPTSWSFVDPKEDADA